MASSCDKFCWTDRLLLFFEFRGELLAAGCADSISMASALVGIYYGVDGGKRNPSKVLSIPHGNWRTCFAEALMMVYLETSLRFILWLSTLRLG